MSRYLFTTKIRILCLPIFAYRSNNVLTGDFQLSCFFTSLLHKGFKLLLIGDLDLPQVEFIISTIDGKQVARLKMHALAHIPGDDKLAFGA